MKKDMTTEERIQFRNEVEDMMREAQDLGDEACRDCEVFISSEDNDIEPKISLEQGNLYFYA